MSAPTTETEPGDGADRRGAHDPYAALRHRDFRLFLAGTVLASVGNEMQAVAVGWELYERTGSALGRGATPAYLLDAALGAAVVAIVTIIRVAPQPRPSEPVSWRSILAGVRFVLRTELILATITLDMFAVLLGGATTLLPIYAKD